MIPQVVSALKKIKSSDMKNKVHDYNNSAESC